jgi:hypothetical protein
MLTPFLACLLQLSSDQSPTPIEPAGVHLSHAIPSFQTKPAPPAWVRLESNALADPDCRHYSYEVYASETQWLVRYVQFPEEREEFREIEQVFLYPKEKEGAKAERIAPSSLWVDLQAARWNGRVFDLVDRRYLVRD